MKELLARIQQDDAEAKEWLYKELHRLHWGSLLRLGQEAEDAFDELYLVMLTVIRECQLQNPDFVWAYARKVKRSIVAHTISQLARGRTLEVVSDNLKEPRPSPEVEAFETERRDVASRLLSKLPPGTRRFIELCYFDDHSAEEIQRLLQLTPQAFYARKSKALKVLRDKANRILEFPKRPEPLGMAA